MSILLLFLWFGAPAFAWQFAVAGDSRGLDADHAINGEILTEIAAALAAESIDLVLFPGDLIYGSAQEGRSREKLDEWRETFVEPLRAVGIRVYSVRGNHDNPLSAWQKTFSGEDAFPQNGPRFEKSQTYSFTHENALFLGLDCYAGPLRSYRVNLHWLYGQLAGNSLPHVFVFGHVPAFSVQHPDSLGLRPIRREIFWNLLGHFGAHVYFCGHDHFFDHAVVPDWRGREVHQIIVGTAGAPLRDWDGSYFSGRVAGLSHIKQYGYLLAAVNGLDVRLTFKERIAPNCFTSTYAFDYSAEQNAHGVEAPDERVVRTPDSR